VLVNNYSYYGWDTQGGRLQYLKSGTYINPTQLQNFEYTYDDVGNINSIVDYNAGGTQTQAFTYDAANRLHTSQASGGTGGTYSLSTYGYSSSTGNLTFGETHLTYNAQVTCTAGNRTLPHAASIAYTSSYTYTYSYDCNGNMIARNVGSAYSLAYDAENRLTGVNGSTNAAFLYDGDGNRVKATVSVTTTVYIGNYFEWSGSTGTMKKYYYAGATRVAMRTGTSTGTTGLKWLLEDHLGSTNVIVNGDGSSFNRLTYKPWGETSSGASSTTFKYTGQRQEKLLGGVEGLYFYGSRWYDDYLNRWIQPDSIIPSNGGSFSPLTVDYHETQFLDQLNQENRKRLEDSQEKAPSVPTNSLAFDRYSYSFNNPLVYSDPDGHFAFLVPLLVGFVIGGAISTAAYIGITRASGKELTWAGGIGAFAGGGVAGMVSVIATPVAGTLLTAAGASASGTALVAGTAAVNAAGGAASYLAGGFTQNAVDSIEGNTPSFKPTLGGAAFNAGVAGGLSPVVGVMFPVANNTVSTLSQASCFMPGRTLGTLFATENARHLYEQTFVATGIGYFAGNQYGQ
jgi:RHS repeat-associated protein